MTNSVSYFFMGSALPLVCPGVCSRLVNERYDSLVRNTEQSRDFRGKTFNFDPLGKFLVMWYITLMKY